MRNSQTRPKKVLRPREARERLGVGKTKFAADFEPQLRRVQLGPRAVGFLEQDVDDLIEKLTAR